MHGNGSWKDKWGKMLESVKLADKYLCLFNYFLNFSLQLNHFIIFIFLFLNTLLILKQFKFREFWQGEQTVPVYPNLNYFCY